MSSENIDRPAHYRKGKIEVWDFIVDQDLDYLTGNIVKYACRHMHKGTPIEDMRKIIAYAKKRIEILENK